MSALSQAAVETDAATLGTCRKGHAYSVVATTGRKVCRPCQREASRRWWAKHPGYLRRWKEANRERVLDIRRRWIERNREKVRAYHASWRRANSERMRGYWRTCRAKKKAATA